jgi:hypothetical protein
MELTKLRNVAAAGRRVVRRGGTRTDEGRKSQIAGRL